MPWNTPSPVGSRSVSSNKSPMGENTTYIETTMGNDVVGTNADTTRDHFWNVAANLDGHHRFVKMPAFTEVVSGGPAAPADPKVGTGMDLVSYARLVSGFDVQPFCRNKNSIMQILGIRAMAVFSGRASNGASTIVYKHNVTSVSRTDEGLYTATFTSNLPTNLYMVLGGAIRNVSDVAGELNFNLQGASNPDNSKSVSRIKMLFKRNNLDVADPLQAWFICFGG